MGISTSQWRAAIGHWSGGKLRHTTLCSNNVGYYWTKGDEQECNFHWFSFVILVALLVIGGVELNPGPQNEEISRSDNGQQEASRLRDQIKRSKERATKAVNRADMFENMLKEYPYPPEENQRLRIQADEERKEAANFLQEAEEAEATLNMFSLSISEPDGASSSPSSLDSENGEMSPRHIYHRIYVATLFLLKGLQQRNINFQLALFMSNAGKYGDIVIREMKEEDHNLQKAYFISLMDEDDAALETEHVEKTFKSFKDYYHKFKEDFSRKEDLKFCKELKDFVFVIHTSGTGGNDIALSAKTPSDPFERIFNTADCENPVLTLDAEGEWKLQIFTNQASLETVCSLIEKEVKTLFSNFNDVSINWIMAKLDREIEKWSAESVGHYMSIIPSFKKIVNDIKSEVCEKLTKIISDKSVKDFASSLDILKTQIFNNTVVKDNMNTYRCENLKYRTGVLVVDCENVSTDAATIHVYHILNTGQGKFVVVGFVGLLNCQHELLFSWKEGKFDLLVIKCERDIVPEEKVTSICEALCGVMTEENLKKRLILICPHESSNTLCQHLKQSLEEKLYSTFTLSQIGKSGSGQQEASRLREHIKRSEERSTKSSNKAKELETMLTQYSFPPEPHQTHGDDTEQKLRLEFQQKMENKDQEHKPQLESFKEQYDEKFQLHNKNLMLHGKPHQTSGDDTEQKLRLEFQQEMKNKDQEHKLQLEQLKQQYDEKYQLLKAELMQRLQHGKPHQTRGDDTEQKLRLKFQQEMENKDQEHKPQLEPFKEQYDEKFQLHNEN